MALSITSAKSQELKKVYSIVKEIQDLSWYKEQQKLWKEEIDKNNKNAVAWENYYNAVRALKNLSWENKEELEKYKKQCETIGKDAYAVVPNSYQANLILWRNSGNEEKYHKYLERAYELSPNNEEVLVNVLTQSKLRGEKEEYSTYCKKYYKTNDVPSGLLNWAYNLLSELDENAIVFTGGDNDSYPCWLVQEVKGIRTDVEVINIYLLLKDDYRNNLFKKLGLPELRLTMSEVKSQEEYQNNRDKILEHIFKNYKSSFYVVTSLVNSFKEQYENELHLTGLAYKYSKTEIDNISLIIRNYEKRYLLDYLKMSFSFSIGEKVAENAQVMYLPALTKLYKHYKNTEQTEKLKKVKELLLSIGNRTGSLEDVEAILKGC